MPSFYSGCELIFLVFIYSKRCHHVTCWMSHTHIHCFETVVYRLSWNNIFFFFIYFLALIILRFVEIAKFRNPISSWAKLHIQMIFFNGNHLPNVFGICLISNHEYLFFSPIHLNPGLETIHFNFYNFEKVRFKYLLMKLIHCWNPNKKQKKLFLFGNTRRH